MDRRRFLTLAGTALAAAVFAPVAATPATAAARRALPIPARGNPETRVYCGSSVNAQGRFRHYLVGGRRVTERTLT